jgi:imidazolonepropionase-like amidohydrolase
VKQVALDGGAPRTLVDWPGHYASASLSADGKEVVFERVGGDRYRGHRYAQEPGVYRHKVGGEGRPRFLCREGSKPRFAADGRRVWLVGREGRKHALVSVDRIGSDRRVHATSARAVDFEVSPDGRWLAFEEEWQAWLLPLPPGPTPLELEPRGKQTPQRRLSEVGGTYLSFSPDSSRVRWSLGPTLFEVPVEVALSSRAPAETDVPPAQRRRGVEACEVPLGFRVEADLPDTDLWLVGGRVAPMHDLSVIEDGVVHIRGNRIVAVGPRSEIPVPEGARVLDTTGHTVMPGLVDVHSHHGSSNHRLHARQCWALLAMLAFGVTTAHDPSNDTQMIHAEAEMVAAGRRLGPRLFSTGTILYGADGEFRAVINSERDAREAIQRTAAWGARSVKSYMQPRRDQRQQVLKAARALGVMVMPEGGSTLHLNLTQVLDGHTTLEHALPVAPLYAPELDLIARSGTGYTPTLVVGYGGFWGENWWYAKTQVWKNDRLLAFVPRSVVEPSARRRTLLTDDAEYHHLRLARSVAEVVRRGGNVEIGAHGQMQGLGAHWEMWMLHQGGLTPHEALRCATYGGARALCLEDQLGSLRPGMLADLIVVAGRPLEVAAHSEQVAYTMVNGRLYRAPTLDQVAPVARALPPGPPLDTIREVPGLSDCACGR